MPTELPEILVESAMAFVFIILFVFVGRFFLQRTNIALPGIDNPHGYSFYSLVFGLLIVTSVYSVIVARGITINILVIPLIILLIKGEAQKGKPPGYIPLPYFSILKVVVLSVIILHLFPESEYKQNDSFYYLKIAESLNRTGQENTHSYYNNFSDIFHGTEPYHYFEIWCTSLVSSVSGFFYSAIQVHRYVVQAVFVTAIILGLYNLVGVVLKRQPRYWHKIFCWSLVFFMPDLLSYFPSLAKYFISNIEGNFLERPNYRILYVLLTAIITENLSERPRQNLICFWLVLLGIVSFKFAVLTVPAVILFVIYGRVFRQGANQKYVIYAGAFGLCFILFYLLTGVQLPTIYNTPVGTLFNETLTHWKFVVFSMFASIGYILLTALVFIIPLMITSKQRNAVSFVFRKNVLLVLLAITGLVAARVLFLKDNAYQFLFAAHIICLLLIWIVATIFLKHSSAVAWIATSILFTSPFIIKLLVHGKTPDIFVQNGNFVYEGSKYSAGYINGVTSYMRKNGLSRGAYIADSSFYDQLYYSRRNPNVYFLPVTYIVAKELNGKFETCISDSAAILKGVNNSVHRDYLQAAIQRSFFYQYRKRYPGLSAEQVQERFITDQNISYLFITKGIQLNLPQDKISRTYTDTETGERFIVLKPY